MTYWPEDAPPYMNGFTTPLLQSAASPAITRRLLEAGANPDGHDDYGTTPLMKATGKVAELLLDKGAKIDARDHEGMTPLMHRAIYNDFAAVQVLLKYRADVNARDNFSQTVLMAANEVNSAELPTTKNQVNVLEMLIAHGATINAHDDAGQTALMAATFVPYGEGAVCNPVFAQVLLRHGADPNACDNKGNTTLMLLVAAIDDIGYEPGDPVLFAKLLLWRGARLDLKNKAGKTALQIAEKYRAKTLARLFRDWKI